MNTLDSSPSSPYWCKQEVREQIRDLKQQLAAHDSNIALLGAFNAGRASLKGKGYTRAAEHYPPTREDKKRLPRTLANLNQQRAAVLRAMNSLQRIYGL